MRTPATILARLAAVYRSPWGWPALQRPVLSGLKVTLPDDLGAVGAQVVPVHYAPEGVTTSAQTTHVICHAVALGQIWTGMLPSVRGLSP